MNYTRLILCLCLAVMPSICQASSVLETKDGAGSKEKESPFYLSLELASRYVWRGIEFGDAPVSFATLGYAMGNFSAWTMGAYAFNGSHQEVDFGLTFTNDFISAGLSDYYFPSATGTSDAYFDLNNHTTGHWGELYATLTPTKLPLWITLSCYIYGADKRPDGHQAYSSYAETGYAFNFKNDRCLSVAIGASLNDGFYNDYYKGFSVINIAIKYDTALSLGSFNLPVSGSYILNPAKEKAFFRFSTYFNF